MWSSEALVTTPTSGKLKRAAILGTMTLIIASAIAVDFPLCPTAGFLGIPCPGCGLTRATLMVFHGDFAEAFHFHPMVYLVSPVYLTVVANLAIGYIRGGATGKPLSARVNLALTVLAVLTFAALFGVWIARFFGAFGGPVDVVTLGTWRAAH